jgi:hypothetical protein
MPQFCGNGVLYDHLALQGGQSVDVADQTDGCTGRAGSTALKRAQDHPNPFVVDEAFKGIRTKAPALHGSHYSRQRLVISLGRVYDARSS